MRALSLLFILPLAMLLAACDNGDLLGRLNPQLKEVEKDLQETKLKLEELGTAMVGQTAPQFGFVTLPVKPGKEAATEEWVQVDLLEANEIDQIVLIPAQVDWHQLEHSTYLFPIRFRVDISDDLAFETSFSVCAFSDSNFPEPDISPVVLPVNGRKARYVRVTVYHPKPFALAELMVMKGNRNLAIHCPVRASGTVAFVPRWDANNLVDGRTPLGPPIRRELLPYDGLYAGMAVDDSPVWMQLDLGSEKSIEEVRLHPVHGRMGVDLPGYAFPLRFRLLSASEPEFLSPAVLFEADGTFSNPGNNVVTLPTRKTRARFLRVQLLFEDLPVTNRRMALSEIEVYSNGVNIARNATVSSTPEHSEKRKDWPKSVLVDGNTSYGRILELPEWLENWTLRKKLKVRLTELTDQQMRLMTAARQRLWWVFGGLGLLVTGAIIGMARHARKLRRQELNAFRQKLTQDFHDEVGSNLAAVGVISDVALAQPTPPGFEFWRDVQQMSREAADAMRETLWIAGGYEAQGINLMEHLQLTAKRMLREQTVQWDSVVSSVPETWPAEAQKQVFLFFKEAVANVVRHSRADTVTLSARLSDGWFELEIRDNGRGFSPDHSRRGIGLTSLQERAARLGGTAAIETLPGQGTQVHLRIRIGA